jgi:hypothetical protein
MYRFVPLTAPENPDVAHPGDAEMRRRSERLHGGYGDAASRPPMSPPPRPPTCASSSLHCHERRGRRRGAADRPRRGDTVIYERDITYLESR